MPESTALRREKVSNALAAFNDAPLSSAANELLDAIGYRSDKTADLGATPQAFLKNISGMHDGARSFREDKAFFSQWKYVDLLFQLTNDEIPSLMLGQAAMSIGQDTLGKQIESFVFVAIELAGNDWSRTKLASITREVNGQFPMPAILVFRYGEKISICLIDRRINRRDSSRDVMEKVSIIKDIRLNSPHQAHVRILAALAPESLGERQRPTNFVELYQAWMDAISVQELNKRFYRDLFHWYIWARKAVSFPCKLVLDEDGLPSIAVIRLLTRLIFVWFIKEKGLVPDALFESDALAQLLEKPPLDHPDEANYYQAILQNLFFATLNVELGPDEKGRARRRWAEDGSRNAHYLVPNVYRFKEAFVNPATVLEKVFSAIPYLNGGLFECLDRELTEQDLKRNKKLKAFAVREGESLVLRIDGFSRREKSQALVPNRVFFGGMQGADLGEEVGGVRRGERVNVKGLIDIFADYKFTVDENTPVEEEVALDPELLGKVFENLLASYNKDTKSTARKQSGSFYTPREVVDYMVDEALVTYFGNGLESAPLNARTTRPVNALLELDAGEGDLPLELRTPVFANEQIRVAGVLELRLRRLLSYRDEPHGFDEKEVTNLIAKIEQLRVLDPACGSGAFPMGILSKLVHVLRKLDPNNARWRAQNRAPLEAQLAAVKRTTAPTLRAERVEEAEGELKHFDETFSANDADYTRKLYLIEKCIHGVDIQPIAVQIAKLRFFISLIVNQERIEGAENFGLTTLPNLETRIVAANTLLPIPRQSQQGSLLDDPRIGELEKALVEANAEYFSARTRRTKLIKRELIYKLHEELSDLLQENSLVTEEDARRMAQFDPFDQNATVDFFDVEWMFGMHRSQARGEAVFHIVIGNPPYVRQEELGEQKAKFKDLYECASGTADLYVYFYERSMQLLAPDGVLSFITSNKWFRTGYGKPLRTYMRVNSRIRSVIDFGDESVFTALAYPTIVVAQKREKPLNPPLESDQLRALNWNKAYPVNAFPEVFAAQAFMVPQAELRAESWQLEPPLKRQLLSRLRNAGMPLGEYVKGRLYRGILTGLNEAFVVDQATRDKLILDDPKSAEIIKPFLRGRDVKQWRLEAQGLWLIFTRRGTDIRKYPAIHKHLKAFKGQLMPKPGEWDDITDGAWTGRKAGTYEWFEIQDNIAYWEEFEKPKLLVPAISEKPSFAPDLDAYFSNNKATIVVPEVGTFYFVLAVLNSSVNSWFATQVCATKQGGYYDFEPRYSSQLLIPSATSAQIATVEIVARLFLESADPRIEQLLNGLVLELFFPVELRQAGIHLFAACDTTSLTALSKMKVLSPVTIAQFLAAIFDNRHPIFAMLFNLQGLDVVRIIEGKE